MIKSLTVALSVAVAAPSFAVSVESLTVPEGFSISVYAENVKNARQMALGKNGVVYVGSRGAGLLHAVVDKDGDFKADEVIQLADKLNMPSGVTYKDGDLYVSEVSKIHKFTNIDQTYSSAPKSEVVIDGLPTEKHHGWKNIDFGPDGWLYVPVGAPCNICDPNHDKEFNNPDYATILRFDLNTGKKEIAAKGVRNSVGFDWHPDTQRLWFSDNGRDWMGDNLPPCELNEVSKLGEHFGYPYYHGGYVQDPEFGVNKKAADYTLPAYNLLAHVAPLGIHFYDGAMFPKEYQGRLLVAEHGSWNRTTKSGYRVMMATIQDGKVTQYQPFIDGFLDSKNDSVIGRPVAFLPLPDGSLLVSDDFADVIYRVTYEQ
ncbi:PQQ-dependent sugar dehydrogenase [Aestuariibacter sp. AA17]|uniref:PQQ-dependent sugar dehydrogenase n=1 Tax=Fluctibacter corallii TaxID=2984329 RepID=A0ABT3ACN9_9ALTE|nr:PQQ-dependent sugar dehydrogenase [Aestuariibacter sp. AA17]MCV2886446.1 PQQ-dependent sugar dehydrogenase [Aestuariibacter sp. AA17]